MQASTFTTFEQLINYALTTDKSPINITRIAPTVLETLKHSTTDILKANLLKIPMARLIPAATSSKGDRGPRQDTRPSNGLALLVLALTQNPHAESTLILDLSNAGLSNDHVRQLEPLNRRYITSLDLSSNPEITSEGYEFLLISLWDVEKEEATFGKITLSQLAGINSPPDYQKAIDQNRERDKITYHVQLRLTNYGSTNTATPFQDVSQDVITPNPLRKAKNPTFTIIGNFAQPETYKMSSVGITSLKAGLKPTNQSSGCCECTVM